jgi:hypothetical protein
VVTTDGHVLLLPNQKSLGHGRSNLFGNPQVLAIPGSGITVHDVGTGDFGDDGLPELVLAYESSQPQFWGIALVPGNGGPIRTSHSSLVPTGLAVGDVNNDGNLDAALFEGDQMEVLCGDGTGSFPKAAAFPPGGIADLQSVSPLST